jgi:hypothetical protein
MVVAKTEIVCTLKFSEFASDKHTVQLFKLSEFIIILKKYWQNLISKVRR